MNRIPLFSIAVSGICLLVFVLLGVNAFRGPVFGSIGPAFLYERPAETRDFEGPSTYPAYRLTAEGRALPIGRVLLASPDAVQLTLFPDLELDDPRDQTVLLIETDVKAIWALVPPASKQEIVLAVRNLAYRVRDQTFRVMRSPAFQDRYRPQLKAIVADAYAKVMADPAIDLAMDAAREALLVERGEQVAEELLPLLLPRVRSAVLDILQPSWAELKRLFAQGEIDLAPLNDAAIDVLRDPKVLEILGREMLALVQAPEAWDLVTLAGRKMIDILIADPRLEVLARDVGRDPAFSREMRALEEDVSVTATSVFYRVVGRDETRRPDPLAVRVLRYVLLTRRRYVALVVPTELYDRVDPGGLARYLPLRPLERGVRG